MFQSDSFKTGVRSILAHKLRSLLTTLGIIFGVSAVISMLSIAEGARREAVEQIRLLGTNNIRINHVELTGEAKEEADAKGSLGLTYRDGELIRPGIPSLAGVATIRFVAEVNGDNGRRALLTLRGATLRLADLGRFMAHSLHRRDVLSEVTLQGEDADLHVRGPGAASAPQEAACRC